MGGICSRKITHQVEEDVLQRGMPGRYSKSGSSKWFGSSSTRTGVETQNGSGNCPSLMELCVRNISKDIDSFIEKYKNFTILPRDISQQIFDELVYSNHLTSASLEAFRDCAIQDVNLGEYPGVGDSWMQVISSQGPSLLSVDLSGSDVTDSGMILLKQCSNLHALSFNFCNQISDHGLEHISGLSNLTSLSFKKSNAITAEGMSAFASLMNLLKLDLERCSRIHGGLVHLKGLIKLESLNIRCCNCIVDADLISIAGLTNLRELQISCCKVTDVGVSYLKGLQKLVLLNMEGCPVTASCLESISALVSLLYLNLNRCFISDEGCAKLSGLKNLSVLNMGFNNITNGCLAHLKGLTNLESLNLDSCKVTDEGLLNLAGLQRMKSLELSDTEVGSNGLSHLSGLANLENLNLSFTAVSDNSLRKLAGLTSLKSLNLDTRQITDTGLVALTISLKIRVMVVPEQYTEMALSDEDDQVFVIDEEQAVQTKEAYSKTLAGRFLNNRSINFGAMRDTLASIWWPVKGVLIQETKYPYVFMFSFFHETDIHRVMDDGSWTFNQQVLLL